MHITHTYSMQYSKEDYIEDRCSYDEYYNQFITHGLIDFLKTHMLRAIMTSKQSAFADVPMFLWDNVQPVIFKEAGHMIHKAGEQIGADRIVRIAKQAAHKVRAETIWYHNQ